MALTVLFLLHKVALDETGEMAQLVKYGYTHMSIWIQVSSNRTDKPDLEAHACRPSAGEAETKEFAL